MSLDFNFDKRIFTQQTTQLVENSSSKIYSPQNFPKLRNATEEEQKEYNITHQYITNTQATDFDIMQQEFQIANSAKFSEINFDIMQQESQITSQIIKPQFY
ncbi:32769_t:CDS:2, partial [Gigaspora margarita]